MSGQHAPLAPSSAHRWGNCGGSVDLIAALPPEPDGPKAIEGTTAHWVVEQLLIYGDLPPIGTACPSTNLPVTHEMQIGAAMFDDHAGRMVGYLGLVVEQHLTCPAIHADCDGTPDAWCWAPDSKTLDVFDYKYGHGYVEVFGNEQLVCYVSGIITKLNGAVGPDTVIRCHIVQPREYGPEGPIRTWTTTGAEILPHITRLRDAAEYARSGTAQCRVGDWCDNCPARHACVALQRAAGRIADVAAAPTPFQITPAALGFELTALRAAAALLEARIEGLQAEAESALRGGQYVPGWEMTPGQSRLRWGDEQRAITLGELYDKPIARTVPCTPRQAIDMGIDESVILAYASREPAAMKLKPVNLTTIQKVLSK